AGRSGPAADREVHERGQITEPASVERARILQSPANYVSIVITGRMVHLRYGREPGQAQYLRLSESQPEDLCASVVFGAGEQAAEGDTGWWMAHSPGKAVRHYAPQEPAILETVGRSKHPINHYPRADHVSARQVQWAPAFRDGHPGFEGYARKF